MRIAFLTSRYPYPIRSGDQLRAAFMLRHLSAQHEVTLYAPADTASEKGSFRSETAPLNIPRLAWNVLSDLFSSLPVQTRFFHVPVLVERFHHALYANEHDVVLAQLVRTSEWVPAVCPVPVVLDMVDLFSYSYSHAPGSASLPWRMVMAVEKPRLKQYERECVHRFQSILLASAAECEYLRQSTWGKNISHVMNGVECAEILTQQLPPPDRTPRILFFGKLDYPPNADAALHFANDLFPAVLHNLPGARFVIAGWEPPRAIHRLAENDPNIELLPDLEDLRPEIMRATVTVVPMRSGGGLQNKILESLACGTPVVTYPHSADAFGQQLPDGMLIASGREAFVGNVLDVLTSPSLRSELSAAARVSIAKDFTWEKQLAPLDSILHDLSRDPAQ